MASCFFQKFIFPLNRLGKSHSAFTDFGKADSTSEHVSQVCVHLFSSWTGNFSVLSIPLIINCALSATPAAGYT